jgi:hypothetical protein
VHGEAGLRRDLRYAAPHLPCPNDLYLLDSQDLLLPRS